MSTANWDEVKRLAADFQRAQLIITSQKLSERNCVEIVRTLQQLNLIDLIYTQDGKEYLTHQELGKEIHEELIAMGGRVNLVDLQTVLNIDLSLIETKVSEIVGQENDLSLVLGQLINRSYLDFISDEINDKLQMNGKLTVAELTKEYDLPGDFMMQMIHHRLGISIIGIADAADPKLFYTDSFLARHRAIIQGHLTACTRPIQLSTIQTKYNLQKNLITKITNDLIENRKINGVLSGGINGQFTPSVFLKAQAKTVEEFYTQNQYLEFDSLKRLGISDPKSYIKKQFADRLDTIFNTKTCALSSRFNDLVDSEIEESIANKSWSDVSSVLPSVLGEVDVTSILTERLKRHDQRRRAVQMAGVYAVSVELNSRCAASFNNAIAESAEQDFKNKPATSDKQTLKDISSIEGGSLSKEERKEQRRNKKSAGVTKPQGANSREIKIKSTKKKGRGNKNEDSEVILQTDETERNAFMNKDEIVLHLQNLSPEDMSSEEDASIEEHKTLIEQLKECPEDLLFFIADNIADPLNQKYKETLQNLQKQQLKSKSDGRKSHDAVIGQISQLWKNGILFEKAVTILGDDVEHVLVRHLLRTLCTDLTNMIFVELAGDHIIFAGDDLTKVTAEMRTKCLASMSDQSLRSVLLKLHTCVNGKSLTQFWSSVEEACSPEYLSVMLRKNDKKKDQQLMLSYREETKEKLIKEDNLASSLHLSVILLILHHFGMVLHAPGKCVPQMVEILRGKVSTEEYGDLLECQDLVMKSIREQDTDICSQTGTLLSRVKCFSLAPKKK